MLRSAASCVVVVWWGSGVWVFGARCGISAADGRVGDGAAVGVGCAFGVGFVERASGCTWGPGTFVWFVGLWAVAAADLGVWVVGGWVGACSCAARACLLGGGSWCTNLNVVRDGSGVVVVAVFVGFAGGGGCCIWRGAVVAGAVCGGLGRSVVVAIARGVA